MDERGGQGSVGGAWLVDFRRDLHAHPELAFAEVRTAARVAERLAATPGLRVETGWAGGTGVVARLAGALGPGPAIALRADLDALPLQETSGAPHASRHAGRMHACGHDGHTAMLLGAAVALAADPAFAGEVVFVFQPAEEGEGGALRMVEEGLFDRHPVDYVFGLHNWPGLPLGEVAVRAGPVMAAADQFDATFTGRGAHAAMPHQGRDPVLAVAQAVAALQGLVSRETDPLAGAVVSVTRLWAGEAHNVVPEAAGLGGTVRALTQTTRDALEAGLRRVLDGVAAATGTTARLDYQRGYPPTVNDPAGAALAAAAAERAVGAAAVRRDRAPSMGAEDFAFMLQARPGCYVWLGIGEDHPPLHSPRYDFADAALEIGVRYWRALVETCLGPSGRLRGGAVGG